MSPEIKDTECVLSGLAIRLRYMRIGFRVVLCTRRLRFLLRASTDDSGYIDLVWRPLFGILVKFEFCP
jgi:hypothetical protein